MNTNANEPDVTREQEDLRNREVAYDATDLSARAVIMFLVCLAIGGVLITVLLWGVYKKMAGTSFVPHGETPQQQLTTIGGSPAVTFPTPRLQPNPVSDLDAFRQREEETLNSYGWVDQARGKVHIPIARAMDLTVAGGLPVQPNATAPPTTKPVGGDAGAAGGINVTPGESELPPPQQ